MALTYRYLSLPFTAHFRSVITDPMLPIKMIESLNHNNKPKTSK